VQQGGDGGKTVSRRCFIGGGTPVRAEKKKPRHAPADTTLPAGLSRTRNGEKWIFKTEKKPAKAQEGNKKPN